MVLCSVSDDTLQLICGFLDQTSDLLTFAAVDRRCCKHANSDAVWKAICAQSWVNVKTPPTTTLSSYLETLSEEQITALLPTNYCVGKGDPVAVAKAVKLIGGEAAANWGSSMRWAQEMQEWKATYIFAERDSMRLEITRDELCGRFWKWEFHPHMVQEGVSLQIDGCFRLDKSYISSFRQGQVMCWEFIQGGLLQVADYPPLQFSRTQDWDWMLHNQFGFFSSITKEEYELLVRRELPAFWPNETQRAENVQMADETFYDSADDEDMDMDTEIFYDSVM